MSLLACLVSLLLLLVLSTRRTVAFDGRIVGGEASSEGAWPFMAAILIKNEETNVLKHICGGTIWNEDTILTAAHCLAEFDDNGDLRPGVLRDASLLFVYLGHAHMQMDGLDKEYFFEVKQLTIHQDFTANDGMQNDVAVIRLEKKIEFTSTHRKASCICDPPSLTKLDGSACIALGWGYLKEGAGVSSESLMQVAVPILSDETCKATYSLYSTEQHICAGYPETGGKDSCQGDSGGPLVCPLLDNPKTYSLAGVVSFGEGCARIGKPGYYARVDSYIPWILQASGES